MNKFTHAALAACLLLGSATGFAQDAATKSDTKKAMSMDDCKAHANTVAGQKATDPATADTDKKCAGMTNGKSMKMKKNSMKKDSMAPMGAASAP
jgi:hypothetical protein